MKTRVLCRYCNATDEGNGQTGHETACPVLDGWKDHADIAAEDIQAEFNLPQESVVEIARLIRAAFQVSR